MTTTSELFSDLERVRALLVTSPLVPSLEASLEPLNRAVQLLARGEDLPVMARERLEREVGAIGLLLDGLGQWLTSKGALTPTYNRQAEFEMEPGLRAAWGGAHLAVEG